MVNFLLNLLIIAYASVGVVSTIAYFSTIKDLYHHKKLSANITSYSIWTITTFITFLYSLFILDDLLFRIISLLGFLCCFIILILSVRLKYLDKNL